MKGLFCEHALSMRSDIRHKSSYASHRSRLEFRTREAGFPFLREISGCLETAAPDPLTSTAQQPERQPDTEGERQCDHEIEFHIPGPSSRPATCAAPSRRPVPRHSGQQESHSAPVRQASEHQPCGYKPGQHNRRRPDKREA